MHADLGEHFEPKGVAIGWRGMLRAPEPCTICCAGNDEDEDEEDDGDSDIMPPELCLLFAISFDNFRRVMACLSYDATERRKR